jgi:hypothetical protein
MEHDKKSPRAQLRKACANGNLSNVKQIVKKYKLTAEDVCEREVFEHYGQSYSLTVLSGASYETKGLNAMQHARVNNHLPVVIWLIAKFGTIVAKTPPPSL